MVCSRPIQANRRLAALRRGGTTLWPPHSLAIRVLRVWLDRTERRFKIAALVRGAGLSQIAISLAHRSEPPRNRQAPGPHHLSPSLHSVLRRRSQYYRLSASRTIKPPT